MTLQRAIPRLLNLMALLLLISFVYLLGLKLWLAFQYQYLTWDSYVYLLNARAFLVWTSPNEYFELLRPPLLPFLIATLWRVTGESVTVASAIQPAFTVAGAVLIYKMGRDMFNTYVGVFSAFTYLAIPIGFLWTNQVLTHGIMDFFVILGVYSMWKASDGSYRYYAIAGVAMALGSLARYTGLLIFPIAGIYMILVVAGRHRVQAPLTTAREVKWISIGLILFISIWAPWLFWNYSFANGNPLASLLAGAGTAAETGPRLPWYSYLFSLPDVLSIEGIVLLSIGIVSVRAFANRRYFLLVVWLLVFFMFYSLFPNKQTRFIADWLSPLALLIGVGFDRILLFFRTRPILRTIVQLFAVIWLASLFLTAYQLSAQDSNFNNSFFASRQFPEAANWITLHSNPGELWAADYAPTFSYYTGIHFLSLASIIDTVRSLHTSLGLYLLQLHVHYVVATKEFAAAHQLDSVKQLGTLTAVGDFDIYQVAS